MENEIDKREPIHFLHIGKNAGNQIKHVFDNVNVSSSPVVMLRQRHSVSLDQLPEDARYFFSIRDPITRFQSGFYSRKRKGQPRLNAKWSEAECIAFGEFENANCLAEALFDETDIGARAYKAMMSISHVAMQQHSWFSKCGQFLRVRPPVHIVRKENLVEDLRTLFDKLCVDDRHIDLTDDPIKAHKNDYTGVPSLSPKAVDNLSRWYAIDIEFYRVCAQWIESN